jgi:hypothetical protein
MIAIFAMNRNDLLPRDLQLVMSYATMVIGEVVILL